jgi:hypothetical protein
MCFGQICRPLMVPELCAGVSTALPQVLRPVDEGVPLPHQTNLPPSQLEIAETTLQQGCDGSPVVHLAAVFQQSQF